MTQDVERRGCPSCGAYSRIITRGDARGTIVSACCETKLPDEPVVLVQDGKLVCPYSDCSAVDQIIELDVATRANELSLGESGTIVAHVGDYRWESDGFECSMCSRRVILPDGLSIEHC